MSNETEHRFQQRGRNVRTGLTSISISTMVPPEQREVWVAKMLYTLQGVVGTLFETTMTTNSIEEVHAALNSGETRELFDERTNTMENSTIKKTERTLRMVHYKSTLTFRST